MGTGGCGDSGCDHVAVGEETIIFTICYFGETKKPERRFKLSHILSIKVIKI
jgi:uncharacterized protein (UPF0128 family)